MPHEYAGHYAAKHPRDAAYDPAVADALRERAKDERITCVEAFEVVDALEATPEEVGRTADLLEYRITKCQLGLFGYSPEKRIIEPATHISDDLHERLSKAASDGRISCVACWEIADALGLPKMTVSAACEGLGLKVGPCQIGAF